MDGDVASCAICFDFDRKLASRLEFRLSGSARCNSDRICRDRDDEYIRIKHETEGIRHALISFDHGWGAFLLSSFPSSETVLPLLLHHDECINHRFFIFPQTVFYSMRWQKIEVILRAQLKFGESLFAVAVCSPSFEILMNYKVGCIGPAGFNSINNVNQTDISSSNRQGRMVQ